MAATDDERVKFWRGRKAAFAAMGRISPDYYVQDGVVPRTRLPETLRRIRELSRTHGLEVANVFHAGDGNLHPLVLYDGAVEGEAERAERARERDPRGVRRRGRVAHRRARHRPRQGLPHAAACSPRTTWPRCCGCGAAFDPDGLCNPGKAFPTPRLCGEVPGPYRRHPAEREGVERW